MHPPRTTSTPGDQHKIGISPNKIIASPLLQSPHKPSVTGSEDVSRNEMVKTAKSVEDVSRQHPYKSPKAEHNNSVQALRVSSKPAETKIADVVKTPPGRLIEAKTDIEIFLNKRKGMLGKPPKSLIGTAFTVSKAKFTYLTTTDQTQEQDTQKQIPGAILLQTRTMDRTGGRDSAIWSNFSQNFGGCLRAPCNILDTLKSTSMIEQWTREAWAAFLKFSRGSAQQTLSQPSNAIIESCTVSLADSPYCAPWKVII
ncbi:hypothetical protein OSTOST_02305 [Ostertagia ostertagi]